MATTPFIRDVPAGAALAALARCVRGGAVPPDASTRCALGWHEAVGRVTAAPVWATRSSPSFDASAMDGIAVRAGADGRSERGTPVFLAPDAYVVPRTGDPCPRTSMPSSCASTSTTTRARAELRAAVVPYQHVRSIGEDVSAAELLLPTGHRLRAVDVAAAAAAGAIDVLVHRAPVVAVVPTGDEIHPVGTDPAPGVILDTNSLMLVAQARRSAPPRGAARSSATSPTRSRPPFATPPHVPTS